jgi:hypothetical protein
MDSFECQVQLRAFLAGKIGKNSIIHKELVKKAQ